MRLFTMKLVETSSANMFSISSFTFSQEAKPGAKESSVVFSCNCSNSQSRGLFRDKLLCSCLFSNFFHQNASLFKRFLINHNLCTLFTKFHKVGGIHTFSMCIWGLLLLGTFRRWSCTKSTNSGNAQKIQVPQHLFILSCFTFPNGHILSQVQSTSLHLVDLLEW